MHIDHIDGDFANNEKENLRFLCPNCHSQTETFGSKRLKKEKNTKIKKENVVKEKTAKIKNKKPQIERKPLKNWPSNEELTNLVWKNPLSQLAKILNVSDNAIKKRCKKLNIQLPPYGYWQRISSGKAHEEALNFQKKETKQKNVVTEEAKSLFLKMRAEGISYRKIAKELKYNRVTVVKYCKLFKNN